MDPKKSLGEFEDRICRVKLWKGGRLFSLRGVCPMSAVTSSWFDVQGVNQISWFFVEEQIAEEVKVNRGHAGVKME